MIEMSNITEYRIAVLSDSATVSFLGMAGCIGFCVEPDIDSRMLGTKLRAIAGEKIDTGTGEQRSKYAIIFVDEALFVRIPEDDFSRIAGKSVPAVIPLPGIRGSTGLGLANLNATIERALGMSLE